MMTDTGGNDSVSASIRHGRMISQMVGGMNPGTSIPCGFSPLLREAAAGSTGRLTRASMRSVRYCAQGQHLAVVRVRSPPEHGADAGRAGGPDNRVAEIPISLTPLPESLVGAAASANTDGFHNDSGWFYDVIFEGDEHATGGPSGGSRRMLFGAPPATVGPLFYPR